MSLASTQAGAEGWVAMARSGYRLWPERDPRLEHGSPDGRPDTFGEIEGAHGLRLSHLFVLPRVTDGYSEGGQLLRISKVLCPTRVRGAQVQEMGEVVRVGEVHTPEDKIGLQAFLSALLGMVGDKGVGRHSW